MRGDRVVAVVGVVLVGSLVHGRAWGYVLSNLDWSWQRDAVEEPFALNTSSFPAGVGSASDIEAAFDAAADRWGAESGADVAYVDGGLTGGTSWSDDGDNVTQYYANTVGTTLAVAQSWGWGDNMTDCDIRVYGENDLGPIPWSADPAGAPVDGYDLEQTLTHELGHCLGLEHSADLDAVMYAYTLPGGGVAERGLHPDDQAGAQAIYGLPGQDNGGSGCVFFASPPNLSGPVP